MIRRLVGSAPMSARSENRDCLRRQRFDLCAVITAGLLLLSAVPLAAQTKPGAGELTIKAVIDGRDELRVTRQGCEWTHHEWGWPANVTLNGQAWNPQEQPQFKFDDPARFLPADAKFTHPELIVKKAR